MIAVPTSARIARISHNDIFIALNPLADSKTLEIIRPSVSIYYFRQLSRKMTQWVRLGAFYTIIERNNAHLEITWIL